MSRPSRVEVLIEDDEHERFVRRYLYRLGHSIHDIYIEDKPSGKGSGEQWVRERYAKAVKACRRRSAHVRTALVVVIDADAVEVRWRVRQFEESLAQAGLAARTDDEAIAHLIPKRNIETWVLCLSERNVDETTDYSSEHGIDTLIRRRPSLFINGLDSAPRRRSAVFLHC